MEIKAKIELYDVRFPKKGAGYPGCSLKRTLQTNYIYAEAPDGLRFIYKILARSK